MNCALVGVTVCAAGCLLVGGHVSAASVQTFGAGSAVSITNAAATFDSLNSTTVVHLENYIEGGLKIATAADSWAADFAMAASLDPFHVAGSLDRAFYAISSGNNEWVVIQTTNLALMHGVEFLYGNTWTTGDPLVPWGNSQAIVDWQTWKNGTIVSVGRIGPEPMLQVGTTIGFYDADGFDQLAVRATIPTSGDPTLQALALDNLAVMLVKQAPIPVVSIEASGPIPVISIWDTLTGYEYRLLFTESLIQPSWAPVPAQQPDGWIPGGGTQVVADFGAAGKPMRFYKVEAR